MLDILVSNRARHGYVAARRRCVLSSKLLALRVRLDRSDSLLQSHPRGQNIGLVQRRPMHFRKKGGTRTPIQAPARVPGVSIKGAYGLGYY